MPVPSLPSGLAKMHLSSTSAASLPPCAEVDVTPHEHASAAFFGDFAFAASGGGKGKMAHGRTARLKGNDLHGGILRFGCKRNPDWGQRRKGAIAGACRRLKVAPKDV